MASLRIKSGAATGAIFTLREGNTRIGRSEENDFQISDPSISGSHCEIALDDSRNLVIRDLDSTNGTFVAGRRTSQGLIRQGQTLRLGSVELVFESASPSDAAPTVRLRDGATFPEDQKRPDAAQPALEDLSTVQDLSIAYVVSTPDGELKAPLDAAGHDHLSVSFAPGVVLEERYALERELGRGNMGQVFLAQDHRLNRPVAIKVIALGGQQARRVSDVRPEQLQAFEDEARLGANLNHQAIATVHDFGLHQGNPFTVFEYIEGETLLEFIRRRKRIPLDEVRLIAASLAQGLDFAHSRQIVHRDLKPANIRATAQGYFKILDLGLAKQMQQLDGRRGFAGTPAYASPEQAAGLPVDGRTDQGLTLWP